MDYPGRLIAGFMAIILIIIFPLPYIAGTNSENIDGLVDDYTRELSDTIRDKGYIDKSMYENYVNYLDTTGELYDFEIEDIHPVTGDEVDTASNTESGFLTTSVNSKIDANENGILPYNILGGNTFLPFQSIGLSSSGINEIFKNNLMPDVTEASNQKLFSLATHTHTDPCYAGHRHTSNCQIAGDMTKSVYIKYASTYTSSANNWEPITWGCFQVYCASCNKLLCDISIQFSSYGYGGEYIQFSSNTQYYRYDNSGKVINDHSNQCRGAGLESNETYYNNNQKCRNIYLSLSNYVEKLYCTDFDGYWHTTGNMTWTYGNYPALHCGLDGVSFVESSLPYIGCVYCGSYGANYSCGQTHDTTPICNRVVTSITSTNPSQSIIQGNSIISTATATYLDGHTGTVNCSVSGFNTNTIGNQTATLTYTGLIGNAKNNSTISCNVSVNVVSAKILSSITVTPTDQIINRYGTPSFTVMAYYSNNTSKALSSTQYSMTALDTSVTGQHVLTFSYSDGGVTKTAYASVYVDALTSISVIPNSQVVGLNTPQSSLSFAVTATYLYSGSKTVSGFSISGYSPSTPEQQNITITYTENGITKSATTTVKVDALASITVTPTTQTVSLNTPKTSLSFTVTANYLYSGSKTISSGYSVNGYSPSIYGEQNLTISYTENGITKIANVKVYVDVLTSITVTPNTQVVTVNTPKTSLSFTVTATYLYGGNKIISGGYEITGYTSTTPGAQNITISYTENGVTKTAAATVYVNALSSITITPNTKIVSLNTPQSSLSFTVTANYLYSSSNTVSGYNISGYSPTTPGQQNITITYTENGITKSAAVIVCVDALASISVTPYEQTVERYTPKSSLLYSITTSYLFTGNKTVSTGYVIEGYSPSVLGNQNITISYTDNGITKTTTAKVIVTVLHKTCPRCHNTYDMTIDDIDPGCPYCKSRIVGLNVTPDNVEVTKGESLPVTVSAEYGDGSEAVVYGWTSDYDANRTGLQNVTVEYGGYAADLTVWVNDAMITCPVCNNTYPASYEKCPFCAEKVVRIVVNPNIVTVKQYDNIDLQVTAFYADGNSKTVTEWTIDRDTKKKGTYNATVSYEGVSAGITLTVIPLSAIICSICGLVYDTTDNPIGCPVCSKTLTGIEAYLTSGANLVQFGSIPDIEVILVFHDNHREVSAEDYTLENYDAFKLGEQTIIIRYKEFNTVLNIVVVNTLEAITCPNGHVYYRNEDGSNPGCPFCNIAADVGTVYYFDITYTEDILNAVYKDGVYYFDPGNYITVHVVKRDVSLLLKIQKISLKTILLGRKKEFIYGGEVF